jgi:ubiquinone biosynthesis protein UbiJ
MPAPALLCATLEVALNRYLRLEPSALQACAALEGRRIALCADDLDWTLIVEPMAGGVRVAAGTEPPAAPDDGARADAAAGGRCDVRVSAASKRLLGFALRAAGGAQGLPEGLHIDGDAELLDRFGRILLSVGFDLEELLARIVGDGAAHRIAGGLGGVLGWTRRAAQRLALDTSEYLREETHDLASAAEVEEWMDEVDTLRDRVDRLEARLTRLERRPLPAARGRKNA